MHTNRTKSAAIFFLLLLASLSYLFADCYEAKLNVYCFVDEGGFIKMKDLDFENFKAIKPKFNPGLIEGNIWLLLEFTGENNCNYNLDFGSEAIESAHIYTFRDGEWKLYGTTGYGIPRNEMASSLMRQNILLLKNDLGQDAKKYLLVKIKSSYGSTIHLHLRKTHFYESLIISITIIHTIINSFLLAICIFLFIYSIVLKDNLYFTLSLITLAFSGMQVNMTGIGPVYLWNRACTTFGSSVPISSLMICCLHFSLIIFFAAYEKTISKDKKIPGYDIFLLIESLLTAMSTTVCLAQARPITFFYIFFTVSMLSSVLMIILLLDAKIFLKDKFSKELYYWIVAAGLAGLEKLLFFLRAVHRSVIINLNGENNYFFEYMFISLLLFPFLFKTFKGINKKIVSLSDRCEKLKNENIIHNDNKKFMLRGIFEVIDMNAITKNAMNLPAMKYESADSLEIKNIVEFNSAKSMDILTIMHAISSGIKPSGAPVMLKKFIKSCFDYLNIHAEKKNLKLKINCDNIPTAEIIFINPHILELIISNIGIAFVNIAEENSTVEFIFNYDGESLLFLTNTYFEKKEESMEDFLNSFDYISAKKAADIFNAKMETCLTESNLETKFTLSVKPWLYTQNTTHSYVSSFYNPMITHEEKGSYSKTKNTSQETILLIEDNFESINFFEKILRDTCTVLIKSNGLEAWDYLNEPNSQIPNIIISEHSLPYLNGEELFKKCSESRRLQNVPFIMILDASDEGNVVSLMAKGISCCLTKPFSLKDFRSAVHTIISTSTKAKRSVMAQLDNVVNRNLPLSQQPDIPKAEREISSEENNYFNQSVSQLSQREKQVALLISVGKSDKEIAAELHLSPATVATHNKNIFKKLGVHSRVELINKLR